MHFTLNNKLWVFFLPFFLLNTSVHAKLYSDDPDIYADMHGLITSRGFKYESYSVITNDGYILQIFRIVNPFITRAMLKPKPVLLWHGVLTTSENFVMNRKGRLNRNGVYSEDNNTVVNDCKKKLTSTLGFTLSACGFDVWLGNSRGNQYSNKHVNLTTKDTKFWEFSLTQIGIYDVPATIEAILKITKKNSLSIIGHSMGTTINFIMLTLREKYQKCVFPFIALAPVMYLKNTLFAARLVAHLEPTLRGVNFGVGIPSSVVSFVASVCGNSVLNPLCLILYELATGKDALNDDPSRLPAMISEQVDFTSFRVLLHFAQFVNTGRFAGFNFGQNKNMEIYGQKESPSYPLKRIKSKSKHIYLFHGLNDEIVSNKDLLRTHFSIQGNLKVIKWPQWTHNDFTYAKYQNFFLNGDIIKILNLYN